TLAIMPLVGLTPSPCAASTIRLISAVMVSASTAGQAPAWYRRHSCIPYTVSGWRSIQRAARSAWVGGGTLSAFPFPCPAGVAGAGWSAGSAWSPLPLLLALLPKMLGARLGLSYTLFMVRIASP